MAKGNKKPAAAPNVAPPEEGIVATMTPESYSKMMGSMDANHVVDLVRIQHETFRMDPNAAQKYNIPQETINNINRVNAIAQVVIGCQEIAMGNTQFAITMKKAMGADITDIAHQLGIKIDVTKLLPGKTKDGENITIPAEAVTIPKEKKEQIKREMSLQEKLTPKDPNRIYTPEELAEAAKFVGTGDAGLSDYLTSYLSNRSPFRGILNATEFYRQVLLLSAKDDEEKAKIKELSIPELTHRISKIMGSCTFALSGISKFFLNEIKMSNSPIIPFAAFRNSAAGLIDDRTVADMVKAIVIWAVDVQLKEEEAKLKELKKNKKENADKISAAEEEIKSLHNAVCVVTNPSAEIVETLLEKYGQHDKTANNIFQMIVNTYYSKEGLTDVRIESLKKNVEQYAGVILNYFRDPLGQLLNYSLSNITELEFLSEEEKKAAREKAETAKEPEGSEKKPEEPAKEEPKKE